MTTAEQIASNQLLATWLGVIATAILSVLTLALLRRQVSMQNAQKQLEIGLAFNREYVLLWHTPVSPAPTPGAIAPEDWLARFWTLQLSQFVFWDKGVLDHDIFKMWMVRRVIAFRDGLPQKNITAQQFVDSYLREQSGDLGVLESKKYFQVYDQFRQLSTLANRESAQRECIAFVDALKPRTDWMGE